MTVDHSLDSTVVHYSGNAVRLEQHDAIAELVLTADPVGNAIGPASVDELGRALDALPSDARALVVRSSGQDFCVGGDVKGFAASPDLPSYLDRLVADFHEVVSRLTALRIPSVARVTGWTAGGGIGLVNACDLVIAARSARFRTGYVALGLTPDGGVSWHLARALGSHRALDLLLTNEAFGAEEAARSGLVGRIVDDVDLDAHVAHTAAVLASGPGDSAARIKDLVRAASRTTLDEHLRIEHEYMTQSGATSDGSEGVRAFVEKRRPAFGGRSR